MIDERNINNIIELIESSNQKIKAIKETIEEQKSNFELPKNDYNNLSLCVEEVLKSKNFDNVQELFNNLSKNIAFKTDFLKEQYKILDGNIFKIQNIAKHIDQNISDDINSLVEIVETFSYKIKILQGIVNDINIKITSFQGENVEKFLKDFRADCGDFDEEFEQVLRELKQNFKKASDITAKLSKLDTGVDLSKELSSINISINAIMSSISIFDEKYKDLGKAFAESGLYTDLTAKIEDLSYNTKHLIRNIDNFNQVIENGSSVKEQVISLEQKIETINNLIQTINQEGLLEIKAILNSIDTSDDINEIKNSLNTLVQNEKFEEIKESINALNQDEKFEALKESVLSTQSNDAVFEELKTIVANLDNIKILGQFESVLNEIQKEEKISQEKIDELLKITSVVNFSEVGKEISFLSNDLEIISEEIKHSRSISDKSFSKLENIFESFNLTDLKNRIFEFENYLKKFLKKEDLQLFSSDIQAITEKFELANSVIIDGFDDIESLKNYILGLEEKLSDLTNNIENILNENQNKFDSAIEAFDNTYKIDELITTSSELLTQITSSKNSVLTVLNEGQEKLELLIKAMDSTDKFEEMQETLKNNLEQIQSESNDKISELGEISKNISTDMEALKTSMLNIIGENQEKFDEMLLSLDDKLNNQEIQEKLNFVVQSVGEVSNNKELQTVSSKLADEINNGKYLIIDTIRESQLKLEEFVASVDSAHRIEELKNLTCNLQDEIFKTKDTVLNSIRDNQDRFELLIRALDDSDKIEEVNDLSKTIYSEVIASKDSLMATLKNNQAKIEEAIKLTDVNLKIDELEDLSKKIIEEVRFAKEITQNVGRSINTEVLTDLQNSVDDLKSSIAEVHNSVLSVDVKFNEIADKTDVSMLGDLIKERQEQLEYLIRAYDPTSDISSIKTNLEEFVQKENFEELKQKIDFNKDVIYELRSILEDRTNNLELLMKSVENSEDISELNDILFTIDNEQKDIKSTLDYIVKNTENTEISADINELRDILFSLNNEQKDIKSTIENAMNSVENSDDINYLKGVLVDIEQEQKDIQSTLDSIAKDSNISSLKDSIDAINSNEAVYELKSVFEERTRDLELLMKSIESTEDINELRDILINIDNEQKDIKNIIETTLKSTENSDDINYLKEVLVDIEQEQKDIKATLNSIAKDSNISSLKDSIDAINSNEAVYELKSVFEERTRDLELLMKSVESTEDINELRDILFSLNNEQKDIKNIIETTLKSTENSDDINYLKEVLVDIEQEQKDIQSTLDSIVKNTENTEISANINELRDILFSLNNEQKDIKSTIENTMNSVENSDDINYLKGVLVDIEYEQKAIKSAVEQYFPALDNEDIKNSLDIIENKIDSVSEIKDEISTLEQKINSFKSGFNGMLRQEDVSNTFETIYEIKNDISNFSDSINSLKKELGAVSSNKDNEETIEQLENIQYAIKENSSANASNLAVIENKINELKSSADLNYDLKTLLNNIQEDQLALKAMVSSMDDDETITLLKEQIQSSEYAIKDAVEATMAKEDIEQLKHQIENLTQQIVVQVMQVFDNISFEQEAQEIKEFVDESYNGMKNVLNVLKTNIERLLDAPKPIYIEELKQEIGKIAQNLENIGPEMSEYVATITSLRVSLEELAKTQDMVNLLEQNVSNVSIEVDEILKISKDISSQFELLYTHNEAKEDFAKIRTALDNIIEKQQEQAESIQKDDLKGGIDNVNLSINYINENLNEFLGEYRIFQDKLSDTMHNLEGMASTFVQSDSINSEYKKGVSETFKSLKRDFNSVITTVGNLYTDITKVTTLTGEMLDTSAKDKAEILQNMQILKGIVENSDIDKLKDNFSTIIFSINGFMNNVDEKFASIIQDTKGAYEFSSENKEIAENIKSSIVHILEWTNTANREFTRIQDNIEAIKDIFEDSADDIRQINEIKSIVEDLDSAVASRIEEVFDRQIQNKLDNQLLPEFELLDKKIEKKLVQKLAPILEARDQDKDDLKFIINNQLSEETSSLKELIDVVEKNIASKLQNGFEKIFNQDLDFSPIVDKLDSEFALVNDKIDDSLSKIDTELYQANVKIDDSLAKINDEFSSLSSNIEDELNKISKNVKNINFSEVNSKIEIGFDEISQKIDSANLPQVIAQIDDEFSAMNKKLDVDFFEMNKRVVDEFNVIEEKFDARTETLLQNIENSNEQITSEISDFTNKIENKTAQSFENINSKLESQKNIITKNSEATKDEIGNLLIKFDSQTDSVIQTLKINQETIDKKLEKTTLDIDTSLNDIKTEIVKDVDISLDKITSKLNGQSAILKNIEETKEIISKLAEKSATKSDDNVALVLENSQNTIEKISIAIEAQTKSLIETLNSEQKELNQEIKTIASKNASSILENINQAKDDIQLEFVQIIQKIDSQEEKLNSLNTQKDISVILNQIESAKNELGIISGKLDAQTGLVVKNVETSNSKLDKTLEQVTSKLENQSKTVLKNLNENQKSIQQSMAEITGKIDTQTEIVFKNLGESKTELDDISKKIAAQSEFISKNIEELKEELEQELVQIIDKIDAQSENLAKTQDKKLKAFEEKLNDQEKKIQSIDEKLDILIDRLNTAQALDLSEIVIALENRMGSLDDNIKKIVSFVDEE